MDEDGNEIPTQIGLIPIQFNAETVQKDLNACMLNACISSNTNIEIG